MNSSAWSSSHASPHSVDRGPAMYWGYCRQQQRFRMMDLTDYLSNVQDGLSRVMSGASSAYQEMSRSYGIGAGTAQHDATSGRCRGCGAAHEQCHCDCCVEDADILVQARCGETRVIPVAFESDVRKERVVKLQLDRFASAGGRELPWEAKLSETEFTLGGCDVRTVNVTVAVSCGGDTKEAAIAPVPGSVDRCEVGYARLRSEGCGVRPVILAVAVLPNDCDAYRRSCQCGCCH